MTGRGQRSVPADGDGETRLCPADRLAGAVERCLIRPARLIQRRTGRLAANRETTPAREGAALAPESRRLLRIGLLNMQSLAPKLDDIVILLRDQRLDVLCLAETWLTPQIQIQFLSLPRYDII